ncbi:hypothetical protein B0H10DRAFT_2233720 [Mycena sp. CBHHK59/15]|nr:hypothetical protein B0H10DRAFT_2233720 [Mycena sp. CBHHK59/15]
MDDIHASLREQAIQNHRLTAKVGELEIHVSHHLEDLVHARAERDRFEADSKNAAEKIIALSDELSDLRAQHDMLMQTVGSQVVDCKRKREEDEGLGPAFREYNIMPDAERLSSALEFTEADFWRIKLDSTQTTLSARFATPTHSVANKEQHLACLTPHVINVSPSASAGRSPPTGPRSSAYKHTPSQILARVPEMPPTPSPTRKHVPSLPSSPRRIRLRPRHESNMLTFFSKASLRARSMASKHELEAEELEPEITSH